MQSKWIRAALYTYIWSVRRDCLSVCLSVGRSVCHRLFLLDSSTGCNLLHFLVSLFVPDVSCRATTAVSKQFDRLLYVWKIRGLHPTTHPLCGLTKLGFNRSTPETCINTSWQYRGLNLTRYSETVPATPPSEVVFVQVNCKTPLFYSNYTSV
jgi:hypothetical protein